MPSNLDMIREHEDSFLVCHIIVALIAYAWLTRNYKVQLLAVIMTGITLVWITTQADSDLILKAEKQCDRYYVKESDISETCYITPNTYTCVWNRLRVLRLSDLLVGTGLPIIDRYIVQSTKLKDVTCKIWGQTRKTDWNSLSSRAYHEQACQCRHIAEQPWWVYQVLYTAWGSALHIISGFVLAATLALICIVRWWRQEKQPVGSKHMQTVGIRWKFDKEKHDRKVKENHSHPYLNTMRSTMRNAIAWTMLNRGSVINLFGCKDDLGEAAKKKCAYTIQNVQVRTSYNLNRTVDQEGLVDTYEEAIKLAKHGKGNVLVYDSIWYMNADQMADCMSNGKQLWFNVKVVPKHVVSDIYNPYTGKHESKNWNDGITHIEHVCGGDLYAHQSLNLPMKDAFSLEHKGVTYYFSKVKLTDESPEHRGWYDEHQAVYVGRQIAMLYNDGKMSTYFNGLKAETKILLDGAGAAIGGIIPKCIDGKVIPFQISKEEWEEVGKAVNILPVTAVDWHGTLRHRLQTAVNGDDRVCPDEHLDGLCELAAMVRARATLTASIGIAKTFWQCLWMPSRIWVLNKIRWWFGLSGLGWGVTHKVQTCRWITEKGLQAAGNGNSQAAGRGVDGPGSDGASSTSGSCRDARSRPGNRQSSDASSTTSTSTRGGRGGNTGGNTPIRRENKAPVGGMQRGVPPPRGRGGLAGAVRGARQGAPAPNPPVIGRGGHAVGRQGPRHGLAPEAPRRTAQNARDDARAIGVIPDIRLQSEQPQQAAVSQPQVGADVGAATSSRTTSPRLDQAPQGADPHIGCVSEGRATQEGRPVHMPDVENHGSVAGAVVREGRSRVRKTTVPGKRESNKRKGGGPESSTGAVQSVR